MSRPRNPRFAPEGLERRLSPSDVAGLTPVAQFATFAPRTVPMTREAPLPTDPDGDPIPEPAPESEPGHTVPA